MTLILFDVDGTLTATTATDADCYARAFQQVFRFPLPTTDWRAYTHVTDTGIIDELLRRERRRPLTKPEQDSFETQFLLELQTEYRSNPDGFAEIPGAKALLERLHAQPGFTAAIATGGMKATAAFKLQCIGVDAASMPASFANDAQSRAEIARFAVTRANASATDIVYVGDGFWDVCTAAKLGFRFIGVTQESSAPRLRAAGASVCLDNYLDQDAFFRALRQATVPAPRHTTGPIGNSAVRLI